MGWRIMTRIPHRRYTADLHAFPRRSAWCRFTLRARATSRAVGRCNRGFQTPVRVSILCRVRCVSRRRGRLLDDRTHRGSAARAGPSQRSAAAAAPAAPAAAPAARALGLAGARARRRSPPVPRRASPTPAWASASCALIIDYILLLIVFLFVAIALGAIFLGTLISGGTAGALIAGVLLAIANLVISAVYFIWTLDEAGPPGVARPACPRAEHPQRGRRRDADPPAGRAPVAVPVRLRGLRVGDAVGPQRDVARHARIPDRAPGVRVRDLPAVDDVPEPQEAGLPRRPGRDGRRQARPDPRPSSSRTGPASPAPFSLSRLPRARSRASGLWRGRNTASGRRSNEATRRIDSRSAVATRSASASRGRCSAASVIRSAARARSSVVGGTRRIAPGDERLRRRPASRPTPSSRWRRRSSSAEPERPEQQRLVHALEPGDRRPVVEVGGVGRGERRRTGRAGSPCGPLPVAGAAARLAPGELTARRATAGRAGCGRCPGTGTPASPRASRATSRRPRR